MYDDVVRFVFLLLVLVLIVAAVAWPFVTSPKPALDVPTQVSVIGQSTPISVHAKAKKGLKSLTAVLEQNGKRFDVWQLPQPSNEADATYTFPVGTKNAPQLQDGKAELIVAAKANGFLHKGAEWRHEVNVITHPPSVSVDTDTHYLYTGMADLATFSVSGNYTEAGIRVGDQKFRSWPMPGGKPGLFSLYAFAWNMPAGTIPMAYASNGAGNDVTSPLLFEFPKREQPRYTVHELKIDDKFMNKVVGELDPNGSGDLVTRFVRINNEMRKENNKTLADLRFKTAEKFLWSQPFQRQPGASTEATFADHRKYIYNGKQIDEQTHLGYDLAVTQHVGVQASNDGRVVWAAPLGIYGNCIVVDHGYGLQTIYGHLSRIDVKEGDSVQRGQVMGLSGMTGMAGGDHIHFSMQLDGIQIDPKEFWDPHWIADHIAKRVELPGFTGK